jgi:hypothetical protein
VTPPVEALGPEETGLLDRAALLHRRSVSQGMPAEVAFGRLLAEVEEALPEALPSLAAGKAGMDFEVLLEQALGPERLAGDDFPESLAAVVGRAGVPLKIHRNAGAPAVVLHIRAPGQAALIGAGMGALVGAAVARWFPRRWDLAIIVVGAGLGALWAARKLPFTTRHLCAACKTPVTRPACECPRCGAQLTWRIL